MEIIHPVLGDVVWTYNIKENYVDKDDPCMGILASVLFTHFFTTDKIKGYPPVQFIFGCDMTVQNINTECELIRQKNQTKINKDNNRENMKV